MKHRLLSLFLSAALLLSLCPTFTVSAEAEAVSVPNADVLNIDFSSGNAADTNGHIVTPGSGAIETSSGLGASIKAMRTAKNGGNAPVGLRCNVNEDDYAKIESSFTMECYFNTSSLVGEQAIFSSQESGGCGFEINEGKLIFYARFDRSKEWAVYDKVEFPQISTNSWIHAVAVYDGSALRLYVNGREADVQTDLPNTLVLPNASSFYVGADSNGSNGSELPLHEGSLINRAKLYSTALSAEQVEALFASLPGVKNAGLTLEGDQNAASVTFGVLSDVHITDYDDTGSSTRLKKALKYFAENGAVSTVIAGDVSDYGSERCLTNYVKTVRAAETGDMTVHQSEGNHDRYIDAKNFSQCTGESGWAHYKINGYHFILISPDNNDDAEGDYGSSREWLAEQLKIAKADTGDRPIFVFAHHAVKNTVFVSDEWYGNLTKADFSDYPQVVFFSGHSHAPNNNPKSIWQGEFTAVNTATLYRTDMVKGYGNSVTPEGGNNFAQGLLVNVSGSTVTVTTRDFIADQDVTAQVWTFDTAEIVEKGVDYFPYNNVRRLMSAKAPCFEEAAEITVDRVTMPNVTVTFPQAKIDGSDVGDIVYAYRFELWNSDGQLVTSRREWSDFYRTEMAETITKTIPGVEADTDYTMYIYPTNAYGMEGEPISVFFTTKDGHADDADVFSVDFSQNDATDAAGHKLIVKGEPVMENDDYIGGKVAVFDGDNDAYMYEFSAEDYQRIEDSFTMELYYKPENTVGGKCPFSGQNAGGLGFEYTDGKLVFYAKFIDNNDWTGVPIPVRVGQWNHVFVTYDGAEIRAYLNGSLQACVAQTGKLQPPSDTAYKMVIGADINNYQVAEGQHQCQVAYAKIYSTCRTAKADVLNVDFRTQGSLDAAGHEAETLGSPTITENGILGSNTASFDGSDDGYKYRLSEADYESIKYSFSMELYYKPESLAYATCPFSGQQDGGMGFEHDGNCLNFWAHFSEGYVSLAIPVKKDEWNHVAVTYDGMELKAYLNGALVSSCYQSGGVDLPATEAATCFIIGGDPGGDGSLTSGADCEVAVARIYSTTLSAKEVQECFSGVAGGGLIISHRSASEWTPLTYGYEEGSRVTYTIKNAGSSTLNQLTAAISSGSEYFEVSAPTATTLQPGQSAQVTVTTKVGLSAAASAYTGTLTVSSYSGDFVTEKLSQKVNKATVVISALDQTAYVGDAVPSLSAPQEGVHYSVSGLAAGETLKTAPSLTYAGSVNMSVPGVVTIKIHGAAVQNADNYNPIEYKTGTLSICSSLLPTADVLDVDFNSVLSYEDTNGHAVTQYGAPVLAYNEDIERTTARFDGSDDAYAYRFEEEDYQKIGDSFTMELYYKPESLSDDSCPFSGQESGGIGYGHDKTVLKLWVHLGGTYVSVPVSVVLNQWNHVAVTYDGAALKAYLNGVLVSTQTAVGDFGLPKEGFRFMVIGGDPCSKGTEANNQCEVALARIYSTCLSASHVALSYSKIGMGHIHIPATEIYGTQEQKITLTGLCYSPDVDFAQPVTTYSNSLAQMSNAFALSAAEESRKVTNGKTSFNNLASSAGFASVSMDTPTGSDPDYATRYYMAETTVQRNGRACKVLLITISDDPKGDKYAVSADFLNKNSGNSALNTDKVYCVTAEAERIYSELASKRSAVAQNQDYIFWVTGANRGSSVGNELAHLLVDAYGTSHTMAYLFGGMNVSTLAKTSADTSKYNCIYNILDADDLTTYLPLGAEYDGWGYKRWGVTIYLGLPSDSGTRSALKSDIEKNYQMYTGTVDRSSRSYIDPSYVCYDYYSFSEANGSDIRNVLDQLYAKLPTARAYYESEISYYNSSGSKKTQVCFSFISGLITGVMELTEGDTSSFDLSMLKEVWGYYKEIKYSSENTCDVQPLLKLILRHGMHANKISDIVDLSSLSDLFSLNSKKFVMKEAMIHTLPESYLSVLSLADPSRAMMDTLPDSGAVDTLRADPFILVGDKAFYADQKFTAELSDGVYHLSFSYADGSECVLYSEAKLYLLSETDTVSRVFYSADNKTYQPIPIAYQTAQKRYLLDVPSPGGYLKTEGIIDKPTFPQEGGADKTFVYTGSEQTLELVGFDEATMLISGNVYTDANETGYTVTVVPKEGYVWSTEGDCIFTWVIAKAEMESEGRQAHGVVYWTKDSTAKITLPTLPDGAAFGAVSVEGVTGVSGSISDGELTLTVSKDITQSVSAFTVNVAVSGGTNYNDYTVAVSVDVTHQSVVLSDPVLSGGAVTLSVTASLNAPTEVCFTVACYDAQGRMLGMTVASEVIDSSTTSITLAYPTNITESDAAKWQVMVLDASGFFPLGHTIEG